MTDRSTLSYDETIAVDDRVKVTGKPLIKEQAIGTVKSIAGDKGLTHEYVCVGVEFDDSPGNVFYWYPWECEKV